jgi:integrase
MPGRERALLYALALRTGLRANELRSLTAASFNLDAGTVTVAAAYSKHRREDILPLPPEILGDLR